MTKVKEAFLYDFFSRAELEFLMALPKDEEIQHDFSNAFEKKMKNVIQPHQGQDQTHPEHSPQPPPQL